MLREKIEKIIKKTNSAEDAAYLICFLFEFQVGGLNAKGSFDDDPEMQNQLQNSYGQMAARVQKMLA